MELILPALGGLVSTIFTLDLLVDLVRRRRPHVAAYAVGMAMFSAATWAFVYGIGAGWNGPAYRVFFLFGAVLNPLYLALGSTFLVIGRRTGHVLTVVVAAISAISITLVATVPFTQPLPVGGVPTDIFPPLTEGFGPRMLAAAGGGLGATLLMLLSLVSILRFRRTNPQIVRGNALILAGTLTAALQGTVVALGGEGAFAILLSVVAVLLWTGYRVTKGARPTPSPRVRLVLLGPSTVTAERAHAEQTIRLLENAGYRVFCPARDLESWGEVGSSAADLVQQTFRAIDSADVVLADLHDGYGVVMVGYAAAKKVPVVVATPQGQRIPRPIRGIALMEIYYTRPEEIVKRLQEAVPAPEVVAEEPVPAL